LARRKHGKGKAMTDYMYKIDWTAAPDWAQWAAMDGDADVWWHQHEPDLVARSWHVGSGDIALQGNAPDAANWRESLRQRPSAQPENPKLWRDMTPEEKGALLLAHHEGKVIEAYLFNEWHEADWSTRPYPMPSVAYRIRPEPKRETVTRHLSHAGVAYPVTIDVVDGVLQWDTLKPLPKVAK
jgi:hypothetical protein